jgi:hypothetical protein
LNEAFVHLEEQFKTLAQQANAVLQEAKAAKLVLTTPELLADYTNKFFTEVVPVQVPQQEPMVIQTQAPIPAGTAIYAYPDGQIVNPNGFQQPQQLPQQQVQRQAFPAAPQPAGGQQQVDLSSIPLDQLWQHTGALEQNGYFRNKYIVAE